MSTPLGVCAVSAQQARFHAGWRGLDTTHAGWRGMDTTTKPAGFEMAGFDFYRLSNIENACFTTALNSPKGKSIDPL